VEKEVTFASLVPLFIKSPHWRIKGNCKIRFILLLEVI